MRGTLSRFGWALLLALSSMIAAGTRSCVSTAHAEPATVVRGVGWIGLTISDVQRSAEFYAHVLGFEKTADVEQAGESIEQLEGVFGARTRTVRLQLGRECLDLIEYLAPRGRPAPVDSRSNARTIWSIGRRRCMQPTWPRPLPPCARGAPHWSPQGWFRFRTRAWDTRARCLPVTPTAM